MMTGRSPSGRAGRPAAQAPAGLGDTATIPNAGFTRGPWHVFPSGFAAQRQQVEINDPSGMTVACAIKFIPAYADESAANANLIAAAPELYDALEDAKVAIEAALAAYVFDELTGKFLYDTHDKAEAALAKAGGEQ